MRRSGLFVLLGSLLVLTACKGCNEGSDQLFTPPVVTELKPATGPTEGGTVVLIKGDLFSPNAVVRFGEVEGTEVTVADGQTLTVSVPPADAAGAVDVEIENPGESNVIFTAGFDYYELPADAAPAPTVTSLYPNQGPLDGGTVVEVTGADLQRDALVFVGGRPARKVTWLSDTSLTAVTPPGVREENVSVAVTNPDGRSGRLSGGFAYFVPTEPAPKVNGIAPNQGTVLGNEALRVSGADFHSQARVYVGGRPATGVALVGEDLVCLTPAGRPGLKDVSVVNPDGQTATMPEAYNYFTEPPRLLRVDPIEGPIEGATELVILGRGFDTNTNFLIDDKPVVALTIVDDRSATAQSPPGDRGGYVDVTVIGTGALSDTLAGGFYYIDDANPPLGETGDRLSLIRVSPSTGPEAGGTPVTLLGTGFKTGATVAVSGVPANDVRVLGPTSIAARTPPGTPGPALVEVQNPDGSRASLDLGFTYYGAGGGAGAPQVTAVSPNTGPTSGGTRALVTGANFAPGVNVFFGDSAATNVSVISSSRLTVSAPVASQSGPVNVTVVTPGGASGQLVSGFVYYAMGAQQQQQSSPIINTLTPAAGPIGEATPVVIAGDRFQPGALVFFGGSPASAVTVDNVAQLSVLTPTDGVGPVDVTVTNPDGLSVTRNSGYNFAPPAPVIASLTPSQGPLAGGITALVVGTGFVPGATVLFGATPSVDVTVSDTTVLRALVPPGAAGTVDLTVRNPDGQEDTLAMAFEYDPDWVDAPPPAIEQILPSRGPPTGGSWILIRGTGLQTGGRVWFGEAESTQVTMSPDGEAAVVTPPGNPGPVHVRWMNPDGQSSVLAGGFTYGAPGSFGPPPRLTGVTPTAGPASGTTNVLVTGRDLQENAYIFFGGVLARNPVRLSANIYSAQALPHPPGVVTVAVTHPDGQSAALEDAFTYVPAPEVIGLLPVAGDTTGGTRVTVTGTGFQPGASISFAGVDASAVSVVSATVLECDTPPGPAGPVTVVVRNPDGQWGTLADGFIYIPPPSFDSATPVSPSSGPTTGGSIVVISGDGFQDGATVTVRGQSAQVEWVDATTLVISTPGGVVGNADIVVTNPDGQTATLSDGFLYRDPASMGPPPTLTSPDPSRGPDTGDSRIRINGGGFMDGAQVFFGLKPGAATIYLNPALMATTTPSHSTGLVELAVTNPDGQTARLTDGFEFVDASTLGPAPTLTLVTPQTASRFGGTSVILTGTGFQNGAVAFFGGYPAVTTTNGATEAQATAPAHPEGPAPVQLTNPDGQTARFPGTFEYIIPPPTLATVLPSSGPTSGGTAVSVFGSDLHPDVVITFGVAPAVSCSWVDSSQVDCETPPGTDGPVQVTVTNPDGKTASLAGGFTYAAPPLLFSVLPTSGPEAGGTRIVLSGLNFVDPVTVEVGGVAATAVTFVSSAAVQATTPPGVGPAVVRVINADGQEASLAGGFTYLPPIPPPSISGITPDYGVETGGTNVTIAGSGFQAGCTVSFGGNVSPTVRVLSPTYLSVVSPAGAVGLVDVVVSNPDSQTATVPNGFQYIAQGQLPPLGLDQILPDRGPIAGGNVVTVLGRGFKVGAIVTFAGAACTSPEYIGPGAINCTVPGGLPGPVDVTVTNPTSESVTLILGYTYGDGGAYYIAPQPLPPETLTGKRNSVLLDVDSDGDLDYLLLFNNYNWLMYNDGFGNFSPPAVEALAWTNGWTRTNVSFAAPPVDLNGDGTLDLVVQGRISEPDGSPYADGIYFFSNDGGSFSPIQRIGNNTYVSGVKTFVDVDNDGDPDMIWGRNTDEILFRNDGTGNFTEESGNFPGLTDATRAVCAGDVDLDGDQDIFVSNDLDQQKRLYLNDGTGLFTDVSATHLNALGGNSQDCELFDIEKDGDLDIILLNMNQQDRIYINDGTGHFTDGTLGRLPLETDPSEYLLMVDVNFDGDEDMVVYLSSTPHERIYLSDGNGQYVPANPDMVPPVRGPDYGWNFGDVNGDGYPDQIRRHEGGQNRLLMNEPNGTGERIFVDRTMTAYPSEWENLRTLELVDVDNDGDLDIIGGWDGAFTGYPPTWNSNLPWTQASIQATHYRGETKLYLNDGGGNFFDYSDTNLPLITVSPADITSADFNGDGWIDFAVTDMQTTNNQTLLYINDGTGSFIEHSYPSFPLDAFTGGAITSFDVDDDGRPDILVSGGSGIRFWRNAGNDPFGFPFFTDMSSTTLPAMSGASYDRWVWRFGVGDLNGDGYEDLVLAKPYTNKLYQWDPIGQQFLDVTDAQMPSPSSARAVHLFDADQDGDLDVIFASCGDDRLYLNTGLGFLADNTLSNLPKLGCSADYAIVDPNGDGLPDLINVNYPGSSLPQQNRLLINQGAALFVEAPASRISTDDDYAFEVVAGDLDGDGRDDLVVGNEGQSRVYFGAP